MCSKELKKRKREKCNMLSKKEPVMVIGNNWRERKKKQYNYIIKNGALTTFPEGPSNSSNYVTL